MKGHTLREETSKKERPLNNILWLCTYDLSQHCDYGEMKDEMIRDCGAM